MIEIIPALLCESQEEFIQKTKIIEPFALFAQIDVMDGSWLDGKKTWCDIDSISETISPLLYEIHFMVRDPMEKLSKWAAIPAVKRVIFHFETVTQPKQIIEAIRYHGMEAVLAVNPETAFDEVAEFVPYVDEVMIMTVKPGASGRPFERGVLEKISRCADAGHGIIVGVDGAISVETIPDCVAAGATRLRVNSSLFKATIPPADAWTTLIRVAETRPIR